jgi:hypothetical protein
VDATSVSGPGEGRPIEAKRKNQNSQKWQFQKLQNRKHQNLENFCHKFVFREIDLEIVLHKTGFVFSRSATKRSLLRLFASSSPLLHSQCARCIFNASKQCPNEATTFYLAEQPR